MAGSDQPKPDKAVEKITKVEEQAKQEEKKEVEVQAKAQGEAKPAAETAGKAEEKKLKAEEKKPAEKKREVVLERTYNFSLAKAYAKPETKRGIAAMKLLRGLLARHMKAEQSKVRIDSALAEKIRARGHSNPLKYVRVIASKDKEGIVIAKLAA
ncbi:MAG: 50S ribosomal protein L31e [Candidatus Micrarchaeia archaeon]|jgi:ribosomal protein L31E